LNIFLQWLCDEMKCKQVKELNPAEWAFARNDSTPQQYNGSDCGVFVLMFADYIIDDLPLKVTYRDMPLYRNKIAAAILRNRVK
jgi:Ulp1 family protease